MRRILTGSCALALVLLLDAPARPLRADVAPRLPGLAAPARVVTDRYGIPHLQARTLDDLYYLWGWVTARDRLWQLIDQRASARGQRHRWYGNSELGNDGGAQLFMLRERADAIWARDREDPALRAAIERYTAGVNDYIRDCRSGLRRWPPELAALHEQPVDWRPEDCELLLLGLGVTLDLDLPELAEDAQLRQHGAAWLSARRRFEDRWTFDTVPDSLAGPATRDAAHRAPGPSGSALPAPTGALVERLAALAPVHAPDGSDRASNAFVVGPKRSASGRPLLANDPHLGLTTPCAFHLVHLSVPGVVEAAGAAVPGLPCIVSGRSTRCAWGVTALGADVIDVYADSLSSDGRRVKGPAGWVPVVTKPFDLTYLLLGVPLPPFGQARRYTPHGPVVAWDPKNHLAIAARWSAMEDERISMRALVGVERSRDAEELARRYRSLVTPCINLMVADVDGRTIYQATGLVPKRTFATGPGVLPGDGRHEWAGFIPADSMPAYRPAPDGFAVNGNNRPAHRASPYGWPRYAWAQDRAARMAERLAGDRSVTLADAASVQNDVLSRGALRQLPALLDAIAPGITSLPPRERAALDAVRGWDGATRRHLVAPTIARAWWSAYLRRSHFDGVPGLALATLTGEASDTLRSPAGTVETRTEAAAGALTMALDTLSAKLGPDVARWPWGRAHAAHFRNGLTRHGRGSRYEPPLTPIDGDGSTVSVGPSNVPWNFEVTHGSTFRHVVDLADPLTSWIVITPWNGASAAPVDLRTRWQDHRYVPLRMDWNAIARESAESVTYGARARAN